MTLALTDDRGIFEEYAKGDNVTFDFLVQLPKTRTLLLCKGLIGGSIYETLVNLVDLLQHPRPRLFYF